MARGAIRGPMGRNFKGIIGMTRKMALGCFTGGVGRRLKEFGAMGS